MSAPASRSPGAGDGGGFGERSSLARLTDALSAAGVWHKVRGDHLDFRCPRPDHDDADASGSADWRPGSGDRAGAVRLVCHACGPSATAAVIAALGLGWGDLFDDRPARPPASSPRARSSAAPGAKRAPADRPQKNLGSGAPSAPAVIRSGRGKSSPPAARGPLVATYVYRWADSTIAGECRRYESPDVDEGKGKRRKTFTWRRPSGSGGWDYRMPSPCPLYRLPELAAARTAAGDDDAPIAVWLVEGEKNADALAAAGALAVSAPNGAHQGWAPEYGAELAGAAVVIVADRDQQGSARAEDVRAALVGVAASVRVVRTPIDTRGADASDHLDAGYGLDAFEEVPAPATAATGRAALPAPDVPADDEDAGPDGDHASVIRLPGVPSEDDGDQRRGRAGGGDGGGPGGRPSRSRIVRAEYAQVDDDGGAVVEMKPQRHGDGTDLVELLDARVRIARRIVVDPGDGTPVAVGFVDLVAEKDGETLQLDRVPIEDFRKARWLDRLPWSVSWRDTAEGRSRLAAAITRTSGPVPVVTSYGSLGWHEIGGRAVYVHAGGGIDADGPVSGIEVDVAPRLQAFTLPAPPAAGPELAAALRGVLDVLDALPARVAAPAMGAALRAVLGEVRSSAFVIGHTGSRKSGLAALAQQLAMPSARHNRLPVGAGESATTPTALEELLWQVGDALLVADDLAPDRGAERSANRANELLRMAGNGSSKLRGARSGGLRADRPPRGMLMLTGEDGASRPSAESRTTYIAVDPGDVPLDTIKALSVRELREGRSACGAALVRYVASRMPVTEWVDETRDELAAELLTIACPSGADPDGLTSRRADAVAELAVGWRVLLDAGRAGGALDEDQAAAVWERAWSGLVECLGLQGEIASRRGLVDRAADLLRSAIRSGRAHLASESGRAPAADRHGACGWRKDEGQFGDLRPSGDAVGWMTDDRAFVWLDAGAAFAAIERQGRAESDPLAVTPRALTKAMMIAGVLTTERAPGRATPVPQVRRRAAGQRQRVWELPWSWLWPDDADQDVPGTSRDVPGDDSGDVPPDGATPEDVPETSAPALPFWSDVPPDGPTPEPTSFPAGGTAGTTTDPAAQTASDAVQGSETVEGQQSAVRSGTAAHGEPRGRVARDRATGYRAAGVVVDVDGAHLIGGSELDAGEYESLADLVGWAETLQLGTAHERSRDDAGQIWIMPRLARALGLARCPDAESARATRTHPAVQALTAAGWSVGRRGLQAWTNVFRQGGASVHVVVVPWLGEAVICDPAAPPSARVLAERLDVYSTIVRSPLGEPQPWLWSAGTTGTSLLRMCRATATTRRDLTVRHQPPPAVEEGGRRWERELSWQRGPTIEERAKKWVVAWDCNAQYLAAAANVSLGLGEPRHVTDVPELPGDVGTATAPARSPRGLPPGYWRVPWRASETGVLLPDLCDPAGSEDGEDVWITTPTLVAARQYGADLRPVEAWLWDEETAWMQTWAHSLRDGRYTTDKALEPDPNDAEWKILRGAVKLTYAAGIGMLASPLREGTEHHRPDARHHVIGMAKANLFRKMATAAAAGYALLGVERDCVLVASDTDDKNQAPPPGFVRKNAAPTVIGQMKFDGAVRMDAIADALAEASAPSDKTFGRFE